MVYLLLILARTSSAGQLLAACDLRHVVNYGWQIVGAMLVEAEAPEFDHHVGQVDVLPSIGRHSAQIRQPHVVFAVVQLEGCTPKENIGFHIKIYQSAIQ